MKYRVFLIIGDYPSGKMGRWSPLRRDYTDRSGKKFPPTLGPLTLPSFGAAFARSLTLSSYGWTGSPASGSERSLAVAREASGIRAKADRLLPQIIVQAHIPAVRPPRPP